MSGNATAATPRRPTAVTVTCTQVFSDKVLLICQRLKKTGFSEKEPRPCVFWVLLFFFFGFIGFFRGGKILAYEEYAVVILLS